jgi:PAS domain S-box-containing protein
MEVVKESERFLQNVFNGIQDGISILDRDMNIIRTNKWMEEMYRDSMPLCGKKCYKIYQGRDSICPFCPSVKASETGEKEVTEVPYTTQKGPEGWIRLSAFPLKDDKGNVTGIIEHVRDITEHKKAELEIARFKTFSDQAGQGFGMATLEGEIVYSNQALCDFLEFRSVEEVVGKSVFDFYSAEELEKLKNEILPGVIKTGRWTGELSLFSFKKKEQKAIQNIFLMKDEEGKPKFFANVITDISERKEAEASLQKTIDELQNYKEVVVGRELQMIELKKVINELSKQLGKPEPYDLSFSE